MNLGKRMKAPDREASCRSIPNTLRADEGFIVQMTNPLTQRPKPLFLQYLMNVMIVVYFGDIQGM
jgi:hypothetical protein